MSAPHRRSLANPFAVDLRALAALRIALGAILFVDLGLRLTEVGAQYAGDASYPIERARELLSLPVSVHLVSGAPWYQAGLLVVAMVCALLLALGYRTRWMAGLSWYLLVSLHHRSYHIQDVGDQLLRLLVLWCVFLPIGAHYSLDARRRSRSRPGADRPRTIASVASAGLLLQVALLYFVSVFHKLQGPTWRSGDALEMVLQDDVWVRPLGALLLQVPHLARALTYGTLVVETLAPLLLLSPFATRPLRTIGTAVLACFAVGIGASLHLGVIPWVITAALLPFLPASVWDRLDRRLGIEREPGHAQDPQRKGGVVRQLLPAVLLVQMIVANVDSVRTPRRIPASIRRLEFALGLDQAWGMYAPDPIVISFRVHLRLDLESGETVELVLGSPREGWPDGATLPALERYWDSYRGRMLLDNIVYPEFFPDLDAFVVWACRQWTAAHPDRPVRSVGLSKEVRAVRHTGRARGAEHQRLRLDPMIGHVCADHE